MKIYKKSEFKKKRKNYEFRYLTFIEKLFSQSNAQSLSLTRPTTYNNKRYKMFFVLFSASIPKVCDHGGRWQRKNTSNQEWTNYGNTFTYVNLLFLKTKRPGFLKQCDNYFINHLSLTILFCRDYYISLSPVYFFRDVCHCRRDPSDKKSSCTCNCLCSFNYISHPRTHRFLCVQVSPPQITFYKHHSRIHYSITKWILCMDYTQVLV